MGRRRIPEGESAEEANASLRQAQQAEAERAERLAEEAAAQQARDARREADQRRPGG